MEETDGNLSSVVYTSSGVGLTEREAIKKQVREVSRRIDEERAKHENERARKDRS